MLIKDNEKINWMPKEDYKEYVVKVEEKLKEKDTDTISKLKADNEICFVNADQTSQDDVLDEKEWIAYMDRKQIKNKEFLGFHLKKDSEHRMAWFSALNTITPVAHGVSRKDLEILTLAHKAKWSF